MELLNDIVLFPYYTFNYIFSLFIWVLAVSMITKWYKDTDQLDWIWERWEMVVVRNWNRLYEKIIKKGANFRFFK